MKVGIKKLANGADLPLPHYATPGSAGLDLLAAIDADIELKPGARMAVAAGIAIELPPGVEAQVRPRSGLALNHGITCLNSPGTIDSDYRGEIKVILINHDSEAERLIAVGDRIGQLVLIDLPAVRFDEVGALPASERGEGGFGSTGRGA